MIEVKMAQEYSANTPLKCQFEIDFGKWPVQICPDGKALKASWTYFHLAKCPHAETSSRPKESFFTRTKFHSSTVNKNSLFMLADVSKIFLPLRELRLKHYTISGPHCSSLPGCPTNPSQHSRVPASLLPSPVCPSRDATGAQRAGGGLLLHHAAAQLRRPLSSHLHTPPLPNTTGGRQCLIWR